MRNITTYSELESALMQSIIQGMHSLGDKTKATLISMTRTKFYYAHKPELYKRTQEVLKSITVLYKSKSKNTYEFTVFFDKTKIQARNSTFRLPIGMQRFHHHKSLSGENVAEYMAEMMNYGNRSSRYSYPGAYFYEATKAALYSNKKHLEIIAKQFKKVGLKTSFI